MSRLLLSSSLLSLVLTVACFAQSKSTPPPTAPPPTADPLGSSTTTIVSTPKPPDEPAILEDGGLSIEPIYWLNRAQPNVYGGAAATVLGNLGYSGNAKGAIGGELGIPTGHSNTLRFSYFRVQGNGNTTFSRDSTIFSEAYVAGDYLTASYKIQNAKISWDYLSYTWHKKAGAIRLKTLYEVQLVNAGVNAVAPFKAVTTDSSSGTTNDNTAHGTLNLVFPTFGLGGEQKLGKYFRWEAKASGFGLPRRADIWDAQASVGVRVHQFELLCGEKALHFKTSPKSAQYMSDTLSGAYVGVRYYWGVTE